MTCAENISLVSLTCTVVPEQQYLHSRETGGWFCGSGAPDASEGTLQCWPAQIWNIDVVSKERKARDTTWMLTVPARSGICTHAPSITDPTQLLLTGLSLKPKPKKSRAITRWNLRVSPSQICKKASMVCTLFPLPSPSSKQAYIASLDKVKNLLEPPLA